MILTLTEFNTQKDKLLNKFADAQIADMQRQTWRVRKGFTSLQAKELWLYTYALNSWEHTDGAYNHFTEAQLLSIFEHANTI